MEQPASTMLRSCCLCFEPFLVFGSTVAFRFVCVNPSQRPSTEADVATRQQREPAASDRLLRRLSACSSFNRTGRLASRICMCSVACPGGSSVNQHRVRHRFLADHTSRRMKCASRTGAMHPDSLGSHQLQSVQHSNNRRRVVKQRDFCLVRPSNV